ncbi:hypothetical protein E4T43_01022 [Aureobasidium subglaciale]|nr:hypothetical protein E4T43_01022 [Aureobasidium subglaciale]
MTLDADPESVRAIHRFAWFVENRTVSVVLGVDWEHRVVDNKSIASSTSLVSCKYLHLLTICFFFLSSLPSSSTIPIYFSLAPLLFYWSLDWWVKGKI